MSNYCQPAAIDALTTGTLTYTAGGVSDTAANLITNTGTYLTGAINATVTDAVTAQLAAIDALTTGTTTQLCLRYCGKLTPRPTPASPVGST